MSLHNKPKYQIPELIESLKAHGLDADKPSQLSDAFRTGWVAALAALRSMPQGEPVDKQQEIDTITELNHAQWLALGKASLLIAACNRLSGEAEEFDFDDGLGRGAPQAYWDEFEDTLEQAAEAIDVANKTIHQDHIATPHTAPAGEPLREFAKIVISQLPANAHLVSLARAAILATKGGK